MACRHHQARRPPASPARCSTAWVALASSLPVRRAPTSYRGSDILTEPFPVTAEGTLGGTAQKIGGPLDAQGVIGRQFTEGGSVGGSIQSMLGGSEKSTVQDKQ